jgi:hypothetical protein
MLDGVRMNALNADMAGPILGATTVYRGFCISYEPKPIPSRSFDYAYIHEDYEGPGDHRFGTAASIEECKAGIDRLCDGVKQ